MHDYYKNGKVAAYIGNGKGKTTAAIGQLVRAFGNGLSCGLIQFMKNGSSGECITLEKLGISVSSFGLDDFFLPGKSDILRHRKYCAEGLKAAARYDYDVLVLDEILDTVSLGLITEDELSSLIQKRPQQMELILTGRELSAMIDQMCDLVSEIANVRHYYDSGVTARRGIEF